MICFDAGMRCLYLVRQVVDLHCTKSLLLLLLVARMAAFLRLSVVQRACQSHSQSIDCPRTSLTTLGGTRVKTICVSPVPSVPTTTICPSGPPPTFLSLMVMHPSGMWTELGRKDAGGLLPFAFQQLTHPCESVHGR